MIVLAIMSIICMLAVPQFCAFDRLLLEYECRTLYMTIIMAQHYARATGHEMHITVDNVHQAYSFTNMLGKLQTHQLHPTIEFCVRSDVLGPPAHPSALIKKAITFADNTIKAFPTGIINAGTLYLGTKDKQYLMAISSGVSSISYIRRYEYFKSTWHVIS